MSTWVPKRLIDNSAHQLGRARRSQQLADSALEVFDLALATWPIAAPAAIDRPALIGPGGQLCNSVVAFQQFDKTSADFLTNYMGSDMVEALPLLRPRQAIAVGKAFRSGMPSIFQVPDIVEPEHAEEAAVAVVAEPPPD